MLQPRSWCMRRRAHVRPQKPQTTQSIMAGRVPGLPAAPAKLHPCLSQPLGRALGTAPRGRSAARQKVEQPCMPQLPRHAQVALFHVPKGRSQPKGTCHVAVQTVPNASMGPAGAYHEQNPLEQNLQKAPLSMPCARRACAVRTQDATTRCHLRGLATAHKHFWHPAKVA